jgi:hypothetical protein
VIGAAWRELDRNSAIAQAASEQLSSEARARAHEAVHDSIRQLAERGRAEGTFRDDLPIDWLVTGCLALIHACGDEVRAGRMDADAALDVLSTTMRDLFIGRRRGRGSSRG